MSPSTARHRRYAYEATLPFDDYRGILSPEACLFLVQLHDAFSLEIADLLLRRAERQVQLDQGRFPEFLEETRSIREADWHVGPIPSDLRDRRVEITGPVDRKMTINALNSGAKVFMADFEDAHSPTWTGTLSGQLNLYEAVRRSIEFESPQGKVYRLNDETATLVVRPRGLHLKEKHFLVRGQPIPAALFDFGLFLFHNGRALLGLGSGPYFYLPKLESHHEARLWNTVFNFAQDALDLPRGSIKATVLIETILAAFEMDEIIFELRDHITGLNCGRWDYIFSFIKRFHKHADFVLPDRSQVTMTTHFLRSYSQLLIQTCHRRGAYAMGGMAAHIPVRDDPAANERAFQKVRADKEREAGDGHDGTWVAHPGLVPVAMEVFDKHMPGANQLHRLREEVDISAADLLSVPQGTITEEGVQGNVSVALRYMAAWLGGRGAVPIHNLMEDAATAEIARAQLWQWLRYPGGTLDDGRRITEVMFRRAVAQELESMIGEVHSASAKDCARQAARLVENIAEDDRFAEFLTLPAYELLE